MNFIQAIGLLGLRSSLSQGRYLHRTTQTHTHTHTHKKRIHPYASSGIQTHPRPPVFEGTKKFCALDCAATVIGYSDLLRRNNFPKDLTDGPIFFSHKTCEVDRCTCFSSMCFSHFAIPKTCCDN
jgi:hypothetical protein